MSLVSQVVWMAAVRMLVPLKMIRPPKARRAASPLFTLQPVGQRTAQCCARLFAELSVAELKEMHAKALKLTRWVEEELQRREDRPPEPSAAHEQPRCVPVRAVDVPAALWCASRVLTRRARACEA